MSGNKPFLLLKLVLSGYFTTVTRKKTEENGNCKHTQVKYTSHQKRTKRQFVLEPNLSDISPENIELGSPSFQVPIWKQFHRVFILKERRKSCINTFFKNALVPVTVKQVKLWVCLRCGQRLAL